MLLFCQTVANLEQHFDGEQSSERVVDVAEDDVAQTAAVDWVLGRQGDAADTDDDDDERVETIRRHQAMDIPTYTVNKTAQTYTASLL